jgi:hypothetical protein
MKKLKRSILTFFLLTGLPQASFAVKWPWCADIHDLLSKAQNSVLPLVANETTPPPHKQLFIYEGNTPGDYKVGYLDYKLRSKCVGGPWNTLFVLQADGTFKMDGHITCMTRGYPDNEAQYFCEVYHVKKIKINVESCQFQLKNGGTVLAEFAQDLFLVESSNKEYKILKKNEIEQL